MGIQIPYDDPKKNSDANRCNVFLKPSQHHLEALQLCRYSLSAININTNIIGYVYGFMCGSHITAITLLKNESIQQQHARCQIFSSIIMSSLPAFIALLENLNVPSNEIRAAAEVEYQHATQAPESKVPLLLLGVLIIATTIAVHITSRALNIFLYTTEHTRDLLAPASPSASCRIVAQITDSKRKQRISHFKPSRVSGLTVMCMRTCVCDAMTIELKLSSL